MVPNNGRVPGVIHVVVVVAIIWFCGQRRHRVDASSHVTASHSLLTGDHYGTMSDNSGLVHFECFEFSHFPVHFPSHVHVLPPPPIRVFKKRNTQSTKLTNRLVLIAPTTTTMAAATAILRWTHLINGNALDDRNGSFVFAFWFRNSLQWEMYNNNNNNENCEI